MSIESLQKLVKAARMAMKLAEDTQKMLACRGITVADEISGELCDVLFEINAETLRPDQSFNRDAEIMKLLRSDMNDAQIAQRIHSKTCITQPAPNTIENDEFVRMFRENGGYMRSTPEGDWK